MRNRILVALLGALVIGVVVWYLNGAGRESSEGGKIGGASVATVVPAERRDAPERIDRSSQGDGLRESDSAHAADVTSLQSLLESKVVDWSRVFSILGKLPLDQVWNALSAPGVAKRNETKAYKEQIFSACSLRINSPNQTSPKSNIESLCDDLAKVGNADYFAQQYEDLNKDSAFQQADFRILGKNTKDLSAKEREDESVFLHDFLKQARDPWSVAAAFDALWAMHDDTVVANWDEIDPLSRFQRSRLKGFIRAQLACDAVGGCAPNNPWLLNLCANIPGLACGTSTSLDQIAQNNLSLIELNALRHATGR